jgi:hypothetical protein
VTRESLSIRFSQWAIDELLPPNGGSETDREATVYDLSYAVADDSEVSESYEWRIDDDLYSLTIEGTKLTVANGHATRPVVTVRTTREFMNRCGRCHDVGPRTHRR